MMSLWRVDKPLVLASRSAVRLALLHGAGIPCDAVPADVDERSLEAQAGAIPPDAVAATLADAKAAAVARSHPGRLVLGADQTLAFGGRTFSKAPDRAGARAQLSMLRGEMHELHAAIAVWRDDRAVFAHVSTARLTMRPFSDAFLEGYLDAVGDKAFASVGGYQLEGLGVQLFANIEGDYFTILGLPLLPLLDFLRSEGHAAS